MLREFTLQANEEKRIQVEGKYLVVTKASGPVELTIGGTTPVTVDLHDRIHLRSQSPNDRAIRIKNISGGMNIFEIHTSDLLIDKRQAIDVKESIQIAPNQRIGIDPQTNIVQAIVQNPVKIDPGSNTVKIENGQQIGIDPNTNTVKLENGQLVGFDPNNNTIKLENNQLVGIDPNTNTIKAFIQNPLTLEPGQAVCIDPNCNTVQIQQEDKQYTALDTLTFAAAVNGINDAQTITANALRTELILNADKNNTADVWLSSEQDKGIPLVAGDSITLNSNQAITLNGAENDRVFAAEIAKQVSP